MLPFPSLLYVSWLVFMVATHVSLTIIVYKDSRGLRHPALGISPMLWAGITFSLPIMGMFVYWLMNYSILCRGFSWFSQKDQPNHEKHYYD